jgi:hypothetical protein
MTHSARYDIAASIISDRDRIVPPQQYRFYRAVFKPMNYQFFTNKSNHTPQNQPIPEENQK